MTRILGPGDRGIYAFLLLFGSLVLPLSAMGFGASIIYFISTGRYRPEEIMPTCLWVGLAQGAFNAVVLGVLWKIGWLGETAGQTPPALMFAMLSVLPLQGALLMLTRVLLGASLFAVNNYITILTPTLTSVCLLSLVVFGGLGLSGAVAATLLVNLTITVFVLAVLWRRYGFGRIWNGKFLVASYRYGIKAWFGDLAIRANLRLDQFVLGLSSLPSNLGIYSVAVSLSELLWLVPDAMAFVVFNRIAAEPTPENRARLTEQVHRVLIACMALLAVAMAAGGGLVIRLAFGPKFAAASLPLMLLLPGTFSMTTTKVLTKYFGASGAPGKSSVIQVAGAIVSMIAYLVLIPTLGPAGAAVASSLGYVVTALTSLWLYSRDGQKIWKLFHLNLQDMRWIGNQITLGVGLHGTKKAG